MFEIDDIVFHVNDPRTHMIVVHLDKDNARALDYVLCQREAQYPNVWYCAKDLRLVEEVPVPVKEDASLKTLVDAFVSSNTLNDMINSISSSTVEQLEASISELQRLRYASDCIISGCKSAINDLKKIESYKSSISEIPASIANKLKTTVAPYKLGDRVWIVSKIPHDAGTIVGINTMQGYYIVGWTKEQQPNPGHDTKNEFSVKTYVKAGYTLANVDKIVYFCESYEKNLIKDDNT